MRARSATPAWRLGFNHIGLEERVNGRGMDWAQALQLVEDLCGRCSQANTLAYAQAVEAMSQLIVPPRAAYLRLLVAEMERASSHLLNVAETLDALGMPERGSIFRDLRERLLQVLNEWSGARIQPRLITYGGLTRNIDEGTNRALTLGLPAH